MRDEDGGPLGGELLQPREQLVLGLRIERGGGLVEHQDLRVAHEGARQGDLLPLAAGELLSLLEPAAEHGVDLLRELLDDRSGAAVFHRALDATAVFQGRDPADADVLSRRPLVADEILEEDADAVAQVPDVHVAQVDSAVIDGAFGRVVEAHEQLDQRALAGAVFAHQRHLLAGREPERHSAQHPLVAAWVPEGDVAELDLLRAGPRRRERRKPPGQLASRPDVQVGEEVGHEEAVLVQAADGGQRRLDRRLPLAEDREIKGEVAQRDRAHRRADRHERIGAVERSQRDQPERDSGNALAQGEGTVLGVELLEQRAVALQDQRRQIEQLHFLHVRVAGQDPFQVVLPPAFRRPPGVEPERLARVAGLGDEGRHRGGGDQQHGPGGEPDQQDRVADQDEELLQQRGGLQRHAERAIARLAPRVLHLVVEVRVLEVAQLQRGGLFQDHGVDVIAERGAHQVAEERLPARHGGGERHQARFQRDQPEHLPALRGIAAARRRDHRVDDQLAHPDHGGGQGGLPDQQDDHSRRERARRVAHQREGARQVPEILQGKARALAERLRRRRESHQRSSISCTWALSSR